MIISPLIPFTVIIGATIKVKPTIVAYRWAPAMLISWLIVAPAVILAINYLTGLR